MKLINALTLKNKEMICFVGAGGKSGLLSLLARECAVTGARVLVTTSTKMYYRQLKDCSPQVVLEKEEDLLDKLVKLCSKTNLLAAGKGISGEQKVDGLSKECLDQIYRSGLFDYVLVEADGSRGKSMKAPAEHEPVLPSLATTVLPVVGMDILGCPLTEEFVHRPHLVARVAGQNTGEPVTETTVVKVFRHYELIAKQASPGICWVPVLNKMDCLEERKKARELAMQLLNPTTPRVLLTSALSHNPVLEVIEWFPQ